MAILAKPGGGKSTLIKRIAIAYAYPDRRKKINDELPDNLWFPIFIRCRELGEKVSSSITEIINNIPNRAEIVSCSCQFSAIISDSLQKGTALLLIDGLDEISEDKNRIAFVNQLRTFLATYPSINIIVTSREAGFRVVGGSLATYCVHYIISNLINSEIEELSIKWHKAIIDDSENTIKEARSLAESIIKDNRIRALAENPLLLTTLLFVKRWAGYLPTKKCVLYQEMIKLFLVTWNVEGHEQLDIDESEPQLAYVAFCMSLIGQKNITYDELKKCLIEARNQMPEILGYTKISPSDFINRVESRSSLLILSGHKRLENGQTTAIYEFLHLSFQEYLTAKAIIKKYLPQKEASRSKIDILKQNIKNENWKEIIPLAAVLLERDAKEFIEYLVEETKKIVMEMYEEKENIYNDKKQLPISILGNCITNEIQINQELLENAIECFGKSSIAKDGINEMILNSKFSIIYQNKIKKCFFEKYEDAFLSELGGILGEIYLFNLKIDNQEEIFNTIISDINFNNSKEKNCMAILALMIVFYYKRINIKNKLNLAKLDDIFKELLELIKFDDNHYYFSICWCIAWAEPANSFPDKYRDAFIVILVIKWLELKEYNLYRVTSWAISVILRPNIKIDFFSEILNLKDKIIEKYNKPQNQFDKKTSVYLGILIGIKWDKDELDKLFKNEYRLSNENKALFLFAKKVGIEFKNDEKEK